jgi:hypothetical protein
VELCSTIDPLQNGKIAYIYPKPITAAKSRLIIKKHCVCMFTSKLHLQSLDGRALMSDTIELLAPRRRIDLFRVLFWAFHLWWRRCLTTTNRLNNCFLGIGNGPGQLYTRTTWQPLFGVAPLLDCYKET